MAIQNLHTAIDTLGRASLASTEMFLRMGDEARNHDAVRTKQIRDMNDSIDEFISKMEMVRDSFNTPHPLLTLIDSHSGLDGVSRDDIIDALLMAATAGMPIFCAFAGDPVNMATGNFIYNKIDMNISGRYPLKFERFYNTLGGATDSTMGLNWTHNYDIRLHKEDKKVKIRHGDGHLEAYLEKSDGRYMSLTDKTKVLLKIEEGLVLCSIEMEMHFFDNDGLLTRHTAGGVQTDFSHTNGVLTQVSTLSGRFNFSYDDRGKLIRVSDHSGRETRFEYTRGRLSKVVQPNDGEYTYNYDIEGRLTELINPFGVRETVTEFDSKGRAIRQLMADGGIMEYQYDDVERTTTLVQQNGIPVKYKQDEKYRTIGIEYKNYDGDYQGSEIFQYDASNRKILMLDLNINRIECSYDDIGNMISFTDAAKVQTDLSYTDQRRLSTIAVNGQNKGKYSYDYDGNLIVAEDALQNRTTLSYAEQGIPKTITQPDGSKVQYTYDGRKNIAQLIDATEEVTSYRYDDLNRAIATIDGNGNETQYKYDVSNNIVEVMNALGDVRSYSYNQARAVTAVTDFNGAIMKWEYNVLNKPSKFIDPLGRVTHLDYDNMWNLSHVVGPTGAKTKLKYNERNQLEIVEKPDGSTVKYRYDRRGNRTNITDEAGNGTWFRYDKVDQLIEVKSKAVGEDDFTIEFTYTYNADRKLTSVTDALGNTVNLKYDEAGQLIEETNALGESRRYTYTALGKVSTIIDESGRVTTYDYKPGGRLVAINYPDGTKEAYSYDNVGNVVSLTNRLGQATKYKYDCLNRVVKVENSFGGAKLYTYDAVSNVTSVTDEIGNVTKYEYTLTGQLCKVIDPAGNEVNYTYDARDQLIEVSQSALGLDDASRTTQYERDIMGRVTSITDALGQKESFSYDVRGQLVEKLDKDGYLTKVGYTASGDVNHIQYADGREVKLQYDALRRLSEVEDWLGTTKIEVDALGRATKVTNHQGKEISYTWGMGGSKTSMTYPDGKQVIYGYDEALRLTKVADGTIETLYNYDEHSRLIEKLFSDGSTTAYEYNPLGHLEGLSHGNASGVLDSYKYSYDAMGNRTEILRERRDLPEESGAYAYTYDTLNRLQEVAKNGQLLRSYEYDGFGNRTKMIDGQVETSYSFNALNQLISAADSAGNEQRYSYDKRGNLTQLHRNDILENQYQFGALNRLEQVKNHITGEGAEYRYDGFGNRVGQSIGQFTGASDINPTKHIDDIVDMTKEYNNLLMRQEGDISTSYIWDTNLLYADSGNEVQSYMLDEMGSPVRFGNEAYGYDEFGNMQQATTSAQPFGFTGYQHDPIAGTWFAQAREYDASTGRFTAKDTHWNQENMIWGDRRGIAPDPLAIGQSSNLYGYTMNDPVNRVDMTGCNILSELYRLYRDLTRSGQENYNDDRSLVLPPYIPTLPYGYKGPNQFDPYTEFSITNYRGQIVLRIPDVPRAGSFGPFMAICTSERYELESSQTLLSHEHGHHLGYQPLGPILYYLSIGRLSIQGAGFSPYYGQPWEIIADILAGVWRDEPDRHGNYHHTTNNLLLGLAFDEHINSLCPLGWANFLANDFDEFANHRFDVLKEGWRING